MSSPGFDGFYNYKVRDEARRLAGEYNLEHLRRLLEQEEPDLKHYIADKEKFITQVGERIQTVEGIVFKDTVYLNRRKYGSDSVVYYVGVNHTPQVPEGERHSVTFMAQRFDGGPSKKTAIEYAGQLSKKYNCPINRDGFGEASR